MTAAPRKRPARRRKPGLRDEVARMRIVAPPEAVYQLALGCSKGVTAGGQSYDGRKLTDGERVLLGHVLIDHLRRTLGPDDYWLAEATRAVLASRWPGRFTTPAYRPRNKRGQRA